MKRKWTKEDLSYHIKVNAVDSYSIVIVLSALYKKLYGTLPKGIGLSGFQAENAESLSNLLPEK